jgi:hypothetical protein
MKNIIIIVILILSAHLKIQSQRYAYTGKAWSFSGSIQPLTTFHQKIEKNQLNAMSGSIAISKKIYKGIYPTIGYTYTKTNQEVNSNPRTLNNNALNFNEAHSINSGILIQKHLLVTQSRKISTGCFCQTLSLILSPEYNYMMTNGSRINKSKGEFALKMGVCLFNSYSGNAPKSILWDLYYRKGFTPIVAYDDQYGKQQFYKDEIGIQLRIIFRQRYDFLK